MLFIIYVCIFKQLSKTRYNRENLVEYMRSPELYSCIIYNTHTHTHSRHNVNRIA